MNKLDLRLLYYLDLNARMPISDIARKMHLSKQAITYRLDRLEKEGVILGYAAVIDTAALGKPFHVILYITLQNTTEKRFKSFTEYLANDQLVSAFSVMEGEYDVVAYVSAKDNNEVKAFLDKLRSRFGDLISEVVFNVPTSGYHLARTYLISKEIRDEESLPSSGEQAEVKLDKLDADILRLLANNARMKSTKIASKLNSSPQSVLRRIRNLERRKVIMGYRLALSKIGTGYKLLFSLKNVTDKRSKELVHFLYKNPNVTSLNEMLGGYDIEVGIESEDYNKFRDMRSELRNKFGDIIKRLVSLQYDRTLKYTYLP